MSELLPQLQPRHAFDVRTEWRNNVAFLGETSLVYGVGRHLAVHTLDTTNELGMEQHLKQNMAFIMRPFIDRPPGPPVSTALGGQGVNSTNAATASGTAGFSPAVTAALMPEALASPSSAAAQSGFGAASTAAMMAEMNARQHAAQVNELLEKESFLQDRSTLVSAFGLIACPSNAPSIAESGATGAMDRGARKQLALGEYSEQNRMTVVSILDLRGLQSATGGVVDDVTQVNTKDLRTHTLFLPWNSYLNHAAMSNRKTKGLKRRKAPTEGVSLSMTSVEQSAAAAAMGFSSPAGADRAAAAADVEIEKTIYASSAPRILQHKLKDRSAAGIAAARALRQQQKRDAKQARLEARAASRAAVGLAMDSDEDYTGSSSSGESDDMHRVDSEDEELLSEREEERVRRDEDYDYEASLRAREDDATDDAVPDLSSRKLPMRGSLRSRADHTGDAATRDVTAPSSAPSSSTPTAPVAVRRTLLTRKLTHRLAQTPINQSLGVAFKNGLFQQPPTAFFGSTGSAAPPPHSFTKVVVLEFSHDGRYLAIACDGPRWPLMIWDWQFRTRIMGHPRWVKHEVHTVRWNPHDHTQLCVMGPQVFLQYHLQSSLKHQEASVTSLVTLLHKDEEFSSFTYLEQYADAMVVCKTNKVLVLNRGLVIQSLDISNVLSAVPSTAGAGSAAINQLLINQHRIISVCQTEKGFAVGTSVHPIGGVYPFSHEGLDELSSSKALPSIIAAAASASSAPSVTSVLLLYEFNHSKSLDITPKPDFVFRGAKEPEKVISTTLFDRTLANTAQSNLALQAFRVKCIPLWRTHTGTNRKLPFSLHHLSASPNSSNLALTSSTRELYLLNLAAVDLVDDSLAAQMHLKPVLDGLHTVPIVSMDIAQEQPLIVTCSHEDSSIRLFNYVDHSCEIVKIFEEAPPTCVAMHPSGWEIMVSFDRHIVQLRILLGSSEFLLRGELTLPSTTCIKYSTSGTYIACVSNKVIHVYATNTLKTVVKFHGHSDAITNLSWNGDDSILTSVGANGAVYTWSLKLGGRLHHHDYINKSISYNDVVTLPNGNIVCVGVQQATLGFDLEGLLNPKLESSSAVVATPASPRPGTARSRGSASTAVAPTPSASHNFVVQWNNRSGLASTTASNIHLDSALQYIHYDDTIVATSPKRGQQTATVDGGEVIDALRTAELAVLPFLPVATAHHSRAVSRAIHAIETDASAAKRRPASARKVTASTAVSAAAAADAKADAQSALTRPLAAGTTTLASFLHSQAEKEECPVPPLLCTALLHVGRLSFLLLGTPRGTVQLFLWPLSSAEPLSETALHTEPITALKVCQKTQCVITTSLDGSMFVSSISLVMNYALDTINMRTAAPVDDVALATTFGNNYQRANYIFPAHLFLSKSFFPPLYALASSRLRSEVYGEQRRQIDNEEALAPTRRKAERAKYGVRRLEGIEDEFEYSLVRRGPLMADHRELVDLRAQLRLFQDEWEYKMRRDQESISKRLEEVATKHAIEKRELEAKAATLTMRDTERERLTLERVAKKEKEQEIVVAHLEMLYEKKLALESERYGALLKRFGELELKTNLEHLRQTQASASAISSLTSKHASEVTTLTTKLTSFEAKYRDLQEASVAMQEEGDMEHDHEFQHHVNAATKREEQFNAQLIQHTESQALARAHLAQGAMKIERSAALAHEADLAKQTAEGTAKEVAKKNQALAKKMKLMDETEAKSQQMIVESNAACDKLRAEKAALRDQIAALLEQRALNNPAEIIAGFEKIVREMDDELSEYYQTNRDMSQAARSHKATINALQTEMIVLKQKADQREALFERLREDVLGMKDIRTLKQKYYAFLDRDALSASESQEQEAVEREYTRQTRKNATTIAYLEHKVEEHSKKRLQNNHAHVADNVALMQQVNELRYVNRDFKSEIVRLTGEVAHQKLVLLSHGIGGTALGKQTPGRSTIAQLVAQHHAQAAAMVANAGNAPPKSELQVEIKGLEQKLLQERYNNAALQGQAIETEAALKESNALAANAAGHFASLAQQNEFMLASTFRRVAEQEEEIAALKAAVNAHPRTTKEKSNPPIPKVPRSTRSVDYSAAAPFAPESQPNFASASGPPSTTAAANYVDSVIQRAAALRTHLSNQAPASTPDDRYADIEEDVSGYNIQSSSRPLSAAFHLSGFDSGQHSSSALVGSVGVPQRHAVKVPRPHTATNRPKATTGAATARPASAVSKGGRAGRNSAAWNASSSTASTRTGSVDSSIPGSAFSSAAPTPVPHQQFQQSLRGGQTARERPSSAMHLSTPAPAASTPRSMVAAWLDEGASVRPNPPAPVLRPSSAQTAAQSRQIRPTSAVSLQASRPTSAATQEEDDA